MRKLSSKLSNSGRRRREEQNATDEADPPSINDLQSLLAIDKPGLASNQDKPSLPSIQQTPNLNVDTEDNEAEAALAVPAEYHPLFALCVECKAVFNSSRLLKSPTEGKEKYKWHSNLESLSNSIKQGCHFCSLASSELHQKKELMAAETLGQPISLTIEGTKLWKWAHGQSRMNNGLRVHNILDIEIEVGSNDQNQPAATIKMGVKNTLSAFNHWTPINEALSRNSTSSAEHVEIARFLVHRCITIHHHRRSSCNWHKDDFVPKRLLRLTGTGENLKVSLYITSNSDRNIDYTCLSHRWGESQTLKLMQENIADLEGDIPIHTIPKTYLDAMHITQSLDSNYLWIDSLCIVQNDPVDWNIQALAMAQIYTNSRCTIAAASAMDCHQGCYSTRNPIEITPCRIVGTDEHDSLFAYIRTSPTSNFEDLSHTSPIFTRAWIFQERLLSPRVLYFSDKGIAYNCRCMFASEMDLVGQPFPLQPTGRKHLELWEDAMSDLEWIRCTSLRDRGYFDETELHDTWYQIVKEYSHLKLTYSSDKLIALSGVAQVISNASDFPLTYLAGLWRHTFIKGMLWYVSRDHEPRPSEYRAPTWSWASVEGLIYNDARGTAVYHDMAHFLGAKVSTSAEDPNGWGAVTGSYLKIRGVVKPASALLNNDMKEVYSTEESLLINGNVCGTLYIDAKDEMRRVSYLMPLVRNVKAETLYEFTGLVLHKAGEGYQRVGLFNSKLPCEYFDACEEQDISFIDGDKFTS